LRILHTNELRPSLQACEVHVSLGIYREQILKLLR